LSELTNKSLGISFSDNKINFIELVKENHSSKLSYFDTIEVDFDFEKDLSKFKSDQKVLTNISGEIQKVLSKRGTRFSNVSLTLSTSQSFLLILPFDTSEGKSSINSKIYWELSHFFPENYDELIINTYNLHSVMPSTLCNELLVIAVYKNTLEFVKRIFKLCNIDLTLIDIDHFSAENALRLGYRDEIKNSNVLLLGFKNGRFDIGYVSKGRFRYYTYTKYYKETENNLVLVKKIKNVLNSSYVKNRVDTIYLYGNTINEDSVSALKRLSDFRIEMLNPFLPVTASSDFLQNDEIRKYHYKFSPSCGVALRNI
jgi:Tfp pilus assembly PilM family ATPase